MTIVPDPPKFGHHITGVVPGAWCDSCLSHSAHVAMMVLLGDDVPLSVGSGVYCPQCKNVRSWRDGDPQPEANR